MLATLHQDTFWCGYCLTELNNLCHRETRGGRSAAENISDLESELGTKRPDPKLEGGCDSLTDYGCEKASHTQGKMEAAEEVGHSSGPLSSPSDQTTKVAEDSAQPHWWADESVLTLPENRQVGHVPQKLSHTEQRDDVRIVAYPLPALLKTETLAGVGPCYPDECDSIVSISKTIHREWNCICCSPLDVSKCWKSNLSTSGVADQLVVTFSSFPSNHCVVYPPYNLVIANALPDGHVYSTKYATVGQRFVVSAPRGHEPLIIARTAIIGGMFSMLNRAPATPAVGPTRATADVVAAPEPVALDFASTLSVLPLLSKVQVVNYVVDNEREIGSSPMGALNLPSNRDLLTWLWTDTSSPLLTALGVEADMIRRPFNHVFELSALEPKSGETTNAYLRRVYQLSSKVDAVLAVRSKILAMGVDNTSCGDDWLLWLKSQLGPRVGCLAAASSQLDFQGLLTAKEVRVQGNLVTPRLTEDRLSDLYTIVPGDGDALLVPYGAQDHVGPVYHWQDAETELFATVAAEKFKNRTVEVVDSNLIQRYDSAHIMHKSRVGRRLLARMKQKTSKHSSRRMDDFVADRTGAGVSTNPASSAGSVAPTLIEPAPASGSSTQSGDVDPVLIALPSGNAIRKSNTEASVDSDTKEPEVGGDAVVVDPFVDTPSVLEHDPHGFLVGTSAVADQFASAVLLGPTTSGYMGRLVFETPEAIKQFAIGLSRILPGKVQFSLLGTRRDTGGDIVVTDIIFSHLTPETTEGIYGDFDEVVHIDLSDHKLPFVPVAKPIDMPWGAFTAIHHDRGFVTFACKFSGLLGGMEPTADTVIKESGGLEGAISRLKSAAESGSVMKIATAATGAVHAAKMADDAAGGVGSLRAGRYPGSNRLANMMQNTARAVKLMGGSLPEVPLTAEAVRAAYSNPMYTQQISVANRLPANLAAFGLGVTNFPSTETGAAVAATDVAEASIESSGAAGAPPNVLGVAAPPGLEVVEGADAVQAAAMVGQVTLGPGSVPVLPASYSVIKPGPLPDKMVEMTTQGVLIGGMPGPFVSGDEVKSGSYAFSGAEVNPDRTLLFYTQMCGSAIASLYRPPSLPIPKVLAPSQWKLFMAASVRSVNGSIVSDDDTCQGGSLVEGPLTTMCGLAYHCQVFNGTPLPTPTAVSTSYHVVDGLVIDNLVSTISVNRYRAGPAWLNVMELNRLNAEQTQLAPTQVSSVTGMRSTAIWTAAQHVLSNMSIDLQQMTFVRELVTHLRFLVGMAGGITGANKMPLAPVTYQPLRYTTNDVASGALFVSVMAMSFECFSALITGVNKKDLEMSGPMKAVAEGVLAGEVQVYYVPEVFDPYDMLNLLIGTGLGDYVGFNQSFSCSFAPVTSTAAQQTFVMAGQLPTVLPKPSTYIAGANEVARVLFISREVTAVHNDALFDMLLSPSRDPLVQEVYNRVDQLPVWQSYTLIDLINDCNLLLPLSVNVTFSDATDSIATSSIAKFTTAMLARFANKASDGDFVTALSIVLEAAQQYGLSSAMAHLSIENIVTRLPYGSCYDDWQLAWGMPKVPLYCGASTYNGVIRRWLGGGSPSFIPQDLLMLQQQAIKRTGMIRDPSMERDYSINSPSEFTPGPNYAMTSKMDTVLVQPRIGLSHILTSGATDYCLPVLGIRDTFNVLDTMSAVYFYTSLACAVRTWVYECPQGSLPPDGNRARVNLSTTAIPEPQIGNARQMDVAFVAYGSTYVDLGSTEGEVEKRRKSAICAAYAASRGSPTWSEKDGIVTWSADPACKYMEGCSTLCSGAQHVKTSFQKASNTTYQCSNSGGTPYIGNIIAQTLTDYVQPIIPSAGIRWLMLYSNVLPIDRGLNFTRTLDNVLPGVNTLAAYRSVTDLTVGFTAMTKRLTALQRADGPSFGLPRRLTVVAATDSLGSVVNLTQMGPKWYEPIYLKVTGTTVDKISYMATKFLSTQVMMGDDCVTFNPNCLNPWLRDVFVRMVSTTRARDPMLNLYGSNRGNLVMSIGPLTLWWSLDGGSSGHVYADATLMDVTLADALEKRSLDDGYPITPISYGLLPSFAGSASTGPVGMIPQVRGTTGLDAAHLP